MMDAVAARAAGTERRLRCARAKPADPGSPARLWKRYAVVLEYIKPAICVYASATAAVLDTARKPIM